MLLWDDTIGYFIILANNLLFQRTIYIRHALGCTKHQGYPLTRLTKHYQSYISVIAVPEKFVKHSSTKLLKLNIQFFAYYVCIIFWKI